MHYTDKINDIIVQNYRSLGRSIILSLTRWICPAVTLAFSRSLSLRLILGRRYVEGNAFVAGLLQFNVILGLLHLLQCIAVSLGKLKLHRPRKDQHLVYNNWQPVVQLKIDYNGSICLLHVGLIQSVFKFHTNHYPIYPTRATDFQSTH